MAGPIRGTNGKHNTNGRAAGKRLRARAAALPGSRSTAEAEASAGAGDPLAPAAATARLLMQEEAQRVALVEAEPVPHEIEREPIPALPPAPKAPLRFAPVVLVLLQMVVDSLAVMAAFGFSYWLRFESDIFRRYVEPVVSTYAAMLGVTVGTMLLTFYFSKLYSLKRGASRVDEFYKIAAAVSMGTVLSLATNSLLLGDEFVYSRQILLIGWVLTIFFVTVMRLLYSLLVGELRRHGFDRARVLVVGAGPTAEAVVGRLDHHRTIGYQVVGAVDDSFTSRRDGDEAGGHGGRRRVGRAHVLGNLSHLPEIVRRHKVDEVIVALTGASDHQLREVISLVQDESVSVKIYPDAFQLMTQNEVSVAELSGLPLLTVKDVALRGWNRKLKRAFDVTFSSVVLVVTAPVMLVIALLIKLTSPGPVFFIQTRVGLDGTGFQLVKFRTMRVAVNVSHASQLNDGMPGWTVANDPRRTAFGAFLRRFSLDELPQFYNVLIGEMSVVGPRPEQPEYVRDFATRIPEYLRRHREKAGITGWAQVNGLRGDSSIELRTAADLYYVENWSLLFDLKIIVRTLIAMFKGKNAY